MDQREVKTAGTVHEYMIGPNPYSPDTVQQNCSTPTNEHLPVEYLSSQHRTENRATIQPPNIPLVQIFDTKKTKHVRPERSKLARSREQCPLPRYWVPKAKRVRVQEASVCQRERLLGAVEVVAEDGVAYRIHVKSLSKAG